MSFLVELRVTAFLIDSWSTAKEINCTGFVSSLLNASKSTKACISLASCLLFRFSLSSWQLSLLVVTGDR